MLKQLPFKKEYLLVAGTIILLAVCYRFAFKNTIEAWQLHRQLTEQLVQAADVSYQPGYLDRKNANLSKLIGRYQLDSTAFRSNTISLVSLLAEKEGAVLTSVPTEESYYHTDRYIMQKLEFERSSFALLKLLNSLQNAEGIGYVRSATFKVKESRFNQDGMRKLGMMVYLEALK